MFVEDDGQQEPSVFLVELFEINAVLVNELEQRHRLIRTLRSLAESYLSDEIYQRRNTALERLAV